MSENKQVANETNTRPQEGSVQLPFELIMMIFSWLLPREAFRIARVSRPFKDYVYSSEYARMALKLVVNKADLIASFLNIPSPQFHEAIALTCMQDVQAIDFQLLNHPISNVYVPAALGLVKNATTLNLARSSFIGPIPKEICQLDRLTYLNLTYNDLNGPIPSELGNLVYLTTLNLYNNRIVGLIPKEIGHLNRLKYLNLACNDLKGPIPAELGSLINLETLNFGNNPTLSGTLPPEFGRLVNLSELKLPYTSIKGPIPSEYGQLENLRLMDLSHTNLNCKIPPELGQLKSLVELHLNNCGLYGKIPNNLSKLDKLGYMYLQDNRLEGCVPAGFYDRKFSERPSYSWKKVNLQGNRSSELNTFRWTIKESRPGSW